MADALDAANRARFARDAPLAVVSVASGCAAHLTEAHPGVPVRELCDFVAEWLPRSGLAPRALRLRVCLHLPCSQRYPGPGGAVVERLLAAIPGLQWEPLDAGYGCCGAAGIQMLTRDALAARLVGPLVSQLRSARPDRVVSSNIGCALHLAASWDDGTPVTHPVSLLVEALSGGDVE